MSTELRWPIQSVPISHPFWCHVLKFEQLLRIQFCISNVIWPCTCSFIAKCSIAYTVKEQCISLSTPIFTPLPSLHCIHKIEIRRTILSFHAFSFNLTFMLPKGEGARAFDRTPLTLCMHVLHDLCGNYRIPWLPTPWNLAEQTENILIQNLWKSPFPWKFMHIYYNCNRKGQNAVDHTGVQTQAPCIYSKVLY